MAERHWFSTAEIAAGLPEGPWTKLSVHRQEIERLGERAQRAESLIEKTIKELERQAKGERDEVRRFGAIPEVAAVRATQARAYEMAADLLRKGREGGRR